MKDDGHGGDNWSHQTCKVPVKLSPPTNQHTAFLQADVLVFVQPTVSEHKGTRFTADVSVR